MLLTSSFPSPFAKTREHKRQYDLEGAQNRLLDKLRVDFQATMQQCEATVKEAQALDASLHGDEGSSVETEFCLLGCLFSQELFSQHVFSAFAGDNYTNYVKTLRLRMGVLDPHDEDIPSDVPDEPDVDCAVTLWRVAKSLPGESEEAGVAAKAAVAAAYKNLYSHHDTLTDDAKMFFATYGIVGQDPINPVEQSNFNLTSFLTNVTDLKNTVVANRHLQKQYKAMEDAGKPMLAEDSLPVTASALAQDLQCEITSCVTEDGIKQAQKRVKYTLGAIGRIRSGVVPAQGDIKRSQQSRKRKSEAAVQKAEKDKLKSLQEMQDDLKKRASKDRFCCWQMRSNRRSARTCVSSRICKAS